MQGILIIDKPAGFTSFDVVAKLRGICKTRKIGHSGTLDPMATGVLPVFIGGAAKAVDMQQNTDKAYDAVMLLGRRTDTGDITGETLSQMPVPAGLDEKAIRQVLERFVGPQMQLPPMYSAVKINGQPLYKAARRGEVVERKPRPVVIHSLELTGCVAENQYALHVSCGKGTYVRTLMEDIGTALGVPATLAALRRTQAGPYSQNEAVSLEQVQKARDEGRLEQLLLSVETVFHHLDLIRVDAQGEKRLLNGAPVYRCDVENGLYRIHRDNVFLGVGRVKDGTLYTEKLFVERV
ncbi:tRNA pseudouridine(55) synthase TruB [uncultured Ruthenibacterium sp.]|uniref:tRNA pseudouridine(55) synthase TruB n=1 Tax=uncultured Ruthenibacterium sp. TaxID=1905347 RepID=UPI00349ECC06